MRYKIVESFLSPEECQQVIEMAVPRLQRSTSWSVEDARMQVTEYRTSRQMHFNVGENALISDIERRLSAITRTPIENGEGIQFASYDVNQEYREHYDFFDTRFDGNKSQLNRGGQRNWTCMIYLQSPIRGGETYFPKMGSEGLGGHAFSPVTGRLLMWSNVDNDGREDFTTLHAALPVKEGRKAIITKWIRSSAFR